MIYTNNIPPKARKAYSHIGPLFDVLAGRVEADDNTTKLFSKFDYQSILKHFRQIFMETLLLFPFPREQSPFLRTAKFALVYALTPSILQQIGFHPPSDVSTILRNELDAIFASTKVLRKRFQKEEIAYVLAHCCDKRGFDILLECVDPRAIGYTVQYLDRTATVGMPQVQKKHALSRVDVTPALFILGPWERFGLVDQHYDRIIRYISTNYELKKLLSNADALNKLMRTGPYYYLEDGSFYQSNVEDLFKVLLICGTDAAIDVFFELTALVDSFFIGGTYPESVSRSLRKELRRDFVLELENPTNRNSYNQLYSARAMNFSAKHVLEGVRNKHAVLRWLTLKAVTNAPLPQGITWDEILNIAYNDPSDVVKALAAEIQKKA